VEQVKNFSASRSDKENVRVEIYYRATFVMFNVDTLTPNFVILLNT